jgi:hypothetical protein
MSRRKPPYMDGAERFSLKMLWFFGGKAVGKL